MIAAIGKWEPFLQKRSEIRLAEGECLHVPVSDLVERHRDRAVLGAGLRYVE